jgi:hypothetical protein
MGKIKNQKHNKTKNLLVAHFSEVSDFDVRRNWFGARQKKSFVGCEPMLQRTPN